VLELVLGREVVIPTDDPRLATELDDVLLGGRMLDRDDIPKLLPLGSLDVLDRVTEGVERDTELTLLRLLLEIELVGVRVTCCCL